VSLTVDLAVIATGAFLAALAIGSAGFAFAMVATGIWIYVLPPATIVLMAATCGTLLHGISVWRYRRDIEYRLLWPFVAGGVLGVPVGVLALHHINLAVFRHLIGALMIAYSSYTLLRPRLPTLRFPPSAARSLDAAVGLAGGVLGGLAMLNGVLPTIWCTLRGWDKRRARYVYQPYILFTGMLVMLLAGINVNTELSRVGLYLLVSLPALMAGLWVGLRVFDRMSEDLFRRLLSWLILASGVALQF